MESENKKNRNLKFNSFFFFLFLATIFWFLSKFSEDIETNLSSTINYINVPEDVILTKNNIKEINFDVSGNGFQLLYQKLIKPNIDIDISRFSKETDSMLNITGLEIEKLITEQLKLSQIKNLSQQNILVYLDRNATKKVPVLFNSQISFREGYFQYGVIVLKPDSVLLSGPSEILDTISHIPTKLLKRKGVAEKFSETISLNLPKNNNLFVKPVNINVTVDAEEYSQMSMQVPLEIINLPEDVNLKLFPEALDVTFDISIKDYGYLEPKDFKIVCDYSKRIEDGSFMIPKLVKSPEIIQHIELGTKKVQYLIFK